MSKYHVAKLLINSLVQFIYESMILKYDYMTNHQLFFWIKIIIDYILLQLNFYSAICVQCYLYIKTRVIPIKRQMWLILIAQPLWLRILQSSVVTLYRFHCSKSLTAVTLSYWNLSYLDVWILSFVPYIMASQINWKMSFEILHPVSSGLYPDNGLSMCINLQLLHLSCITLFHCLHNQ